MRDHIIIDMPRFLSYITAMNNVVDNVVKANRSFTATIQALEADGWCDDVYRDAHNRLMDMQEETNVFIDLLYELDSDLVVWYGRIFEEYADEDYNPPHINMERLTVIPALNRRNNDQYHMSVSTVESYVRGTRKYIADITAELDGFDTTHRDFAEFFQTSRYDTLTDELRTPLANMREILTEMEAQAGYVERKMSILWELT